MTDGDVAHVALGKQLFCRTSPRAEGDEAIPTSESPRSRCSHGVHRHGYSGPAQRAHIEAGKGLGAHRKYHGDVPDPHRYAS